MLGLGGWRRNFTNALPLVGLLAGSAAVGHADGPADPLPASAWPSPSDHTAMWWLHGFPGKNGGAAWHRCVRTGRYAFVFDTTALTVPHFGPIEATAYGAATREDDARILALPPAELGLFVQHDGTTYRCVGSVPWNGLSGPRLIESGRFLQRADVDGLICKAEDGQTLNCESRFETVAWPDRLALVLAVRAGLDPLPKAAACFGRVGGGYGFDGTNHLELKHAPALDPATFTLECWVYVPGDHATATKAYPWIVCKNLHEEAAGNYGITVTNGTPQARLNIGGGRDNAFSVTSGKAFQQEAWNHLVMTYDGAVLRLYLDGKLQGEKQIDRPRQPGSRPLAVARRQDNSGDGYHFKGAIDELLIYDRALSAGQIRARFDAPEKPLAEPRPVFTQSFRTDGVALPRRPRFTWKQGRLAVRLTVSGTTLTRRLDLPEGAAPDAWHELALTFAPTALAAADDAARPAGIPAGITVSALRVGSDGATTGDPLPVATDPVRGWNRIDLDGVEPLLPPGGVATEDAAQPPRDARNDALERVRLRLTNATDVEQPARLLLAKTAFRGPHVGTPITGLSAVLRDAAGHPTGIPVQLSKNWHKGRGGHPYDGQWFHGFTQVRLPPQSTADLELVIAYGHWGGAPAASHAQLSLLGWGSNQLWDESAIGSWGETICYEPDQVQGSCSILDVRPLLVRAAADARPWQWTGNVGGGDFLRLFDREGRRVPHVGMRAAYQKHGPCLTEVTYAGRVGTAIDHSATVSIHRSDDIVRGIYHLRMDVREPAAFSRLAIFQIGADSYSYARERQLAMGDAAGLAREWAAQWGGDTYRGPPQPCGEQAPWVSLSGVEEQREGNAMPVGNRGLVIRRWRARLGGHEARPFIAEHGTPSASRPSSTIDVVPPPGVDRLEPGDFVEATFEHLVLPVSAGQYYGADASFRTALETTPDPWRLVYREAVGNDRRVDARRGTVQRLQPDVRVAVEDGSAEFVLHGGLGHVPLTFTGLASHRGGRLEIDGVRLVQAVHGNDFWQTDYDPQSGTWSQTFTMPCPGEGSRRVTFAQ
jgi:hypothetical protein